MLPVWIVGKIANRRRNAARQAPFRVRDRSDRLAPQPGPGALCRNLAHDETARRLINMKQDLPPLPETNPFASPGAAPSSAGQHTGWRSSPRLEQIR